MMAERDAFEQIVAHSRAVVLAAAHRYLGRTASDDCDDVAQDVYIVMYDLWQKGKLAQIEHIDNYIYTLTKHRCLRHNQRQGRLEGMDQDPEAFESPLSAEERIALHEAVQALPDTYRVMMGYVLQGYGLTELSEKLSIKLGTIKSQVSRAKQLLAAKLKEG